MLSQTPGDHGANDVAVEDSVPVAAAANVTDAETIRSLLDVLNATPELQMSNDLNEFLTSPLIDSPFDDELLTTPALESDMHADIFTSPLLGDFGNDSFGEFPSLFDGPNHAVYQEPKPPQIGHHPVPPPHPLVDNMYILDTPLTPLIDTPSTSPLDLNVAPLPSGKRKSAATGTRKNITPASLVPIEAPTQSRNYVVPSATSRKELPATWRRKRLRTTGPDEVDQLVEEPLTPTLSEQEQIEVKRRQNTIAARRSRKRKLEYQRELEESLEQYKRESEMWKQRTLTCQALLRSHHIECPDFPDS